MANHAVEPVLTAPLFPRLYAAHVEMLERLTPEQWDLPTVCEGWSVKDVALHLLGGDIGWLSGGRDGFHEKAAINGWDDLIAFINMRNEVWVRATRRMSARLLTEFVPLLGGMLVEYIDTLDPFASGPAINWAGDAPAPMWMQIGRELTERWTHHQQICDAVGMTSLKDAEMVHAVLSMFVRALPRTYRKTNAPDGTALRLLITGEGGGGWSLLREGGRWVLYRNVEAAATSTVTMTTETAWRLFTKGISSEQGRQETSFAGDAALGARVLEMVSILA